MEQAVQQARYLAGTTEYRELERMRDKAARDEANALSVAEKRGIAIGEKQGIAIGERRGEARGIAIGEKQGIAIGEKQGMVMAAMKMKADGLPLAQIGAYTGLTEQQIQALGNG